MVAAMSTIVQLSQACTVALADADAHGAKVAAHFLRVQIRELFRELNHRGERVDPKAETEAVVNPARLHG
jgi:hypothetical protein